MGLPIAIVLPSPLIDKEKPNKPFGLIPVKVEVKLQTELLGFFSYKYTSPKLELNFGAPTSILSPLSLIEIAWPKPVPEDPTI